MAASKTTKRRLWIIAAAVVVGVIVLSSGPNSGDSGAGGQCLVRVTTEGAPVRSGPDTNDSVGTLPAGLVIQADRTTRNGFRQVVPNRWVAQQHLGPTPGSDCG